MRFAALLIAIGRVADTSIAVARLLFSGHLLKFPGMKLVLSHGGAEGAGAELAEPLPFGASAAAAPGSEGSLQQRKPVS